MKVEVDVDLNKIDYDKIEEAIMKRIESDELDGMLKIGYCTKENIRAVVERNINKKLDDSITRYTNSSPNTVLKDVINDAIKEVIREVCADRIKEVIKEMGGEEKIKEIAQQCIGNMFAAALYDQIRNIVFSSSLQYGEELADRSRNEAKQMIENAFYQSGHPVPSL